MLTISRLQNYLKLTKYIIQTKKYLYSIKMVDKTKPEWLNPINNNTNNSNLYRSGLKLMNSLTGNEDEFITISGTRTLTWYMCGPTVYDASHLGHARTYVCSDIIRRVMASYFGYDIKVKI